MNIGDYEAMEQIGAATGGTLHCARRIVDGGTVLLKLPARGGLPDGLRREFGLLQSLDVPGLLRPLALIDDGPRLAMVLEPFAGTGLDGVLAGEARLSVATVLALACRLARVLAGLHGAGIVHHDLRPANLLLARDGGDVRLADVSRATSAGSAASARPAPADWAYVSPEQTGRMQREADYRTDFYSLGILLYRLLCGQLPFQADDPLEWIHCHLARVPVAPHRLCPDIPEPVSDLVCRLLAKVPEERYQSASGLLADLEHCLAQWRASGAIAPFTLGMRDVSERFRMPSRLYGRVQEKAALLHAFETVAATGTPMIVTVAGYSGVGKSALVHGLQQPIAASHGYFLAGKFDQYKRDIPYATLAQAFDSLVRQILGESDASIAQCRDAIRSALGPVARLMVNLVPQLELVIGPQPPVPELPPQEAQGRFQFVFRRFLGVFARREHPLVLFLDDLQWVDAGTLAVLADLAIHPEVRYLLLVGAYRDNEVGRDHPLMRGLDAIGQAGRTVRSIVLAPLALADVTQLVAESMHCPPAAAEPLAQLVLDKTGGNPFFTRQFLIALAEEKLLRFDAGQGAWRWDLPRIHAKGYTDNVVDLMVGKLARLPRETQDALAQFACLGNAADAATLGIVFERPAPAVRALLDDAERVGLVTWQEDTLTFLHDRVQEAAYSLIPATARAGMHLRLGRLLAAGLPAEAFADRIFEVVSQLNRGSDLVESPAERERIAELDLRAGRRAKAATAYASALAYLAAGMALLAADYRERDHDLVFQLELNRAECEFLTGALADAEQRLALLATRAATTVERSAVACLRIDLYTTLDRSDQAIAVCLDYLRLLGVDWAPTPTKDEARGEYERMWKRIGPRPVEALLDLRRMEDAAARGTMDVLTAVIPAALFTDANLLCLVVGRMVNLSLDHGNSDGSCFAYTWLGMVLGPFFGDYAAAFRFCRLGLDLTERRGLDRFKARVYLNAAIVLPWMEPIASARTWMRRAFDEAQRAGDLTFNAYTHETYVSLLLACGAPLAEVQREVDAGLDFSRRSHFGLITDIITAQLQLVRTLRGSTPVFGCFDEAGFDEACFEAHLEENPQLVQGASWYWIRKLQARCLAGDHAAALAAADKASRMLWLSPSFLETAEYQFYAALSRAASCDGALAEAREGHRQALVEHHRQLQVWAGNCPDNFAAQAALAGAELARLDGRELDAERLYEQAIATASASGFVHHVAIACETAARFHAMRGFKRFADTYLQEAHDAYRRWGADGKARQLEAGNPWLRVPAEPAGATPADSQGRLDLLSVAKAAQAISGQILLDELIESLMRLVLENAGAQSGHLLLVHGDALALAAEAGVEQQAIRVRQYDGAEPPQDRLPLAMVQYVRRSHEAVLLPDAAEPHPFSSDPYFARRHPQSVLCLPILRQSALVGILYLENSLATHAFTPDRVQVLELLASQAAISLDNARLYADVRESHARIRRLVESSIIGIFFWDVNGRIGDANEAFLDMLGYSRQDMLDGQLHWNRMTPPEYQALDEQKLAEVRATRTCTPYEKVFRRKDGSRVPVLVGAVLFDDAPEHGVAFVLDLTERKQAEAEREARRAAEEANRAKSAFLANMSHELRSPLNGILGYAQILERDPALDERQRAGVDVIRKSGEHLLTLINDILDLARIEAGKVTLYPVDVALVRFLRTVIEIVNVKAAQKGLELVCEQPADLPQTVRTDEKRLRQVLLNLLTNAVKFTDQGRITLRVRFVPPPRLAFEVRDTGIGIAAHEREIIFAPFEQAGDVRRREAGTGLGLTISRQYVRLMGGDIEVESEPGRGSVFRFEVDAPPVAAALAAAAPRTVTGYAGPRKKVLVVDDIPANRSVAVDLLAPLGFDVGVASNGREALEAAQRLRPDLILMDIVMPELDGLAVTRRLRQLDAFRHVPVIATSASVSASDGEQSLAAGMDAFLPKPLDADRLLDLMAKLLRLEWTHGAEATRASPDDEPIVVPPAAEMEVLYQMALRGNMLEIVTQAGRLARMDERYRPFVRQLDALARGYQSKAVLRLVAAHLRDGAGAPD
jgi:PAS domain S-box-containing protein